MEGKEDTSGAGADREWRREAIRSLAQTNAGTEQDVSDDLRVTTLDGAAYGKRRLRPVWRWALMLIVLSLLAAGVYGYQFYIASRPKPIPRHLRIDLIASNLFCPEYLAWSPDSLSLAVIAATQNCAMDTSGESDLALAIFNARTGALEKRIGVTSTLSAANLTGPVTAVAWSRDSQSVYVIGAVHSATIQTGAAAMLVVPVGNAHVELYTSSLAEYPQSGIIWSLKGTPSATPISQPLAPALTYSWSRGGVAPIQPFPLTLDHFTGMGERSAAQGGFSFWQPGTVTPVMPPGASFPSKQPPFALIYNTETNQTSPDGTSFASGLSLYGRLQALAGTGSVYNSALCTTAQTKDACLSTAMPYSDKALVAVVRAVEQGVQISQGITTWQSASVAWRPDGAYLAALLPKDGDSNGTSEITVTVYNTRTGGIVARFTEERTFNNATWDDLGVSPVQWSPSGQQIALADFASSAITVWDARSLRA